MIVLVDGYNVMKMVFASNASRLHVEKKKFIQEVGNYFRIKSETVRQIIIFFDGGGTSHMMREVKNGVVIKHSGTRMSADDLIVEAVEKKKGQEIVLVTNDRALIHEAQRTSKYLVAMDSEAFWELVCKTVVMNKKNTSLSLQAENGIKKFEQDDDCILSDESVDALMTMASFQVPDKDAESQNKKPLSSGKKRGTIASVIKKI